jgi:flagellar hook-associated protein 1 FlgK
MTSSVFFGFNLARRGMSAHRLALDVTAHNVANASTPGFSRQQAVFSATTPAVTASANRPGGPGQIGTGVEISEIRRVRDSFLDYQIRPQLSKLGYWEEQYESLNIVEMIMMEPSETGLSNVFERFWGTFQDLANNPTSGATRAQLLGAAQTLTNSLNGVATQLETVVSDLNAKTRIAVSDINSLAQQLASLNQQIVTNVGAGLSPNDLMDQRDLLLDDLSRLTSFTPIFQPNGSVDVAIQGRYLVQQSRASALSVTMDGQHARAQWEDGLAITPKEGKLAGVAATRQWITDDFYGQLNTMVTTMIEEINRVHAEGYDLNGVGGTGNPLDMFINASGEPHRLLRFIEVNPVLLNDRDLIRASTDQNNLANGDNGRRLYAIRNAGLFENNSVSIEGYYSGIISKLGIDSQQAERMLLNQEALAAQLISRREEIAGVSIDEEMSNMIQFQHGYQAAAKLLTVIDEIITTVINLGR